MKRSVNAKCHSKKALLLHFSSRISFSILFSDLWKIIQILTEIDSKSKNFP